MHSQGQGRECKDPDPINFPHHKHGQTGLQVRPVLPPGFSPLLQLMREELRRKEQPGPKVSGKIFRPNHCTNRITTANPGFVSRVTQTCPTVP